MNPTVSVVIPTYNRADKVRGAIESALAQTYAACEIIVVDDGSTDRTREVVDGYAHHGASCGIPVHYLRQVRQGVSVARNTGIAKAMGEWIAFLDSDDRWVPHKLERQINALERFGPDCGACFTDARHVNNPSWPPTVFEQSDGPFETAKGVLGDAPLVIARANHGIRVQTLVVRRNVIEQAGEFDPHLHIGEDNDFVFRVALHTGYCYVNEPLVEIDRTPGRPQGLMELYAKEAFRLEQQQYEHEKWLRDERIIDAEVRHLILTALRCNRAAWASCHLMNGDYAKAREAMAAALAYGFTLRNALKWALVRLAPQATRNLVRMRYQRMVKAILPGF
jgi:glycosyltransferase involved in cell wall biosynthesis